MEVFKAEAPRFQRPSPQVQQQIHLGGKLDFIQDKKILGYGAFTDPWVSKPPSPPPALGVTALPLHANLPAILC